MNGQRTENRPLQQLARDPRLEMLEAALPYIGNGFQQPLAMYIKAQELGHVRERFQDPDTVSACGLSHSNQSLEQMLRAMRGKADDETRPQIDQMLHIIQISKVLPLLLQNQASPTGSDAGASTPPGQEALMSQLLDMMKANR